MTNNDFLPQDYEAPKSGGGYMKFKEGENKFRILSKPVLGWEDWKDNKPVRFKMNEKPEKTFDPKRKLRHFWAMKVWSWAESEIQILQITQAGIQGAIQALAKDENWGDPLKYDIKVMRKGTTIDNTEYNIIAIPHKELPQDVIEANKKTPVNLDALFTGENPFEVSSNKVVTSDLPF